MKHYLKKGERLENLSARYKVPVCMIVRANGFDIKEQGEIEIPRVCYCNKGRNSKPMRFEMYTVGKSDSADSIARAHGITVAELIKLNGMTGSDDIIPGAVISVPIK